jgi:hypothetical protein
MLEQLDSTLFDWVLWRSGDIWNDFHITCKTKNLIENGDILRKYAIGWCRGENLICRPKENHIAIMFYKDNKFFWFHLRNIEFERIFKS